MGKKAEAPATITISIATAKGTIIARRQLQDVPFAMKLYHELIATGEAQPPEKKT